MTEVCRVRDKKFIFIGGLHRSGTTLLAKTLSRHPAITGLVNTGVPMDEGQFLQDVYYPASTKRTLWPIRYLRHLGLDSIGSVGYGGPGRFGYDPRAHLTEESPLASGETARRVFDAWAPYWEDSDASFYLEKSPPNLLRTRFLQALFPRSFFLIVVRHPVPVSLSTRKWTKHRPLGFLFDHWLHCHRKFSSDREHLDRLKLIRYETLTDDPDSVLRDILEFLDVRPAVPAHKVKSGVNRRYYERWERKGTSRLLGWYCDRLRERFGPQFQQFGYSLSDPYVVNAAIH